MDWFSWGDVSWIGVIVATVAGFVVGFAWYHPRFLGGQRARLAAVDIDSVGTVPRHALAGAVLLVTAIVMNVLMAELIVTSVLGGVLFGVVIALVFQLGTLVIHNGFEGRPAVLTAIDGAQSVVSLAFAGAVLGAFL